MNRLVSESARLGKNIQLGFNVIIMDNASLGDNCIVGNNVIIHADSIIGSDVRIDDNTIIGKKPMVSPRSIFKMQKQYDPCNIGDGCLIGTNVIIYVQSKIGSNNLIADLATIRENTQIGDYNIIGRGAAIENFVTIGNRCKFETNCYITAYSEIEDYCFIAPCVATSNDNFMGRDKERYNHFKGVTIKKGGRIGVNSTILPGRVIEEDGMVAAGSLVTKDITSGDMWLGHPARNIGKVNEKQLLINNLDKKKDK